MISSDDPYLARQPAPDMVQCDPSFFEDRPDLIGAFAPETGARRDVVGRSAAPFSPGGEVMRTAKQRGPGPSSVPITRGSAGNVVGIDQHK